MIAEKRVDQRPVAIRKHDELAFMIGARCCSATAMSQIVRFKETIAAYRRHGWQLRRVLMSKSTMDELTASGDNGIDGIAPQVAVVDALWFARPSHASREAWELRLVGETPYALFEAFEADCDPDCREETLRDTELRLIEHATGN